MRGAPVAVVSAPTLADPAVVASPPSPELAADPPTESPPEPGYVRPLLRSPDEASLRRQLEPRVWSGQASVDEIRMLKAICSHMGDHACRNRAAAELARRTDPLGL